MSVIVKDYLVITGISLIIVDLVVLGVDIYSEDIKMVTISA